MKYISVAQTAKKWKVSERMVRNYCAGGRIPGAFLVGKTWLLPEDAVKPKKVRTKPFSPHPLLSALKEQKDMQLRGSIYHKTQIAFTYNSNHMEGSTLSEEQTRLIFETSTINAEDRAVNVDDVVETANHFACVDYVIDNANKPISESMIKELHFILKNGTADSRKPWFNVGEYKGLPNHMGGEETCPPQMVKKEMVALIKGYNDLKETGLQEILDFHQKFESIHPFQDGNGRVGRLLMFKECLKNGIVPFIIDEYHKIYYYRGLKEWGREKGYLTDTCLSCQDVYKKWLEYFNIEY